jgi:hypothetical protein
MMPRAIFVTSSNGGHIADYRFFWWEEETGRVVESPRFATLKAINKHGGRNIEDSRKIVDQGEIDDGGFLKNTKP